MKKTFKLILIILGIIIGIILLDSIQALVFDNNPIYLLTFCLHNSLTIRTGSS